MSTLPNRYRMLLIEQIIEEDSGEFLVEAANPAAAAAILHTAHDKARDNDTNIVTLSDGQHHHIQPTDIIRNRVFCILLDADGNEVGEVEPDFAPPPAAPVRP
jgi:hypothetical protein